MTAVNELTESDATQASKVSVDGGPEHLQLVHTVETLHASAWLSLAKLHYRQPHTGVSLPWEVVRRVPPQCAATSTTASAVADATSTGRWPGLTMDAVDIHAVLRGQQLQPHLLLVLQYRPPVDAYTLEFPSGLVDAGEKPDAAALRELREETGYVGRVTRIGQLIPYEPGLSNSGTHLVHVEVDVDIPENQAPQQALDGEYEQGLEVIRMPLKQLLLNIEELQRKRPNIAVDSRLYTYAVGQHYAETS